MSAIQSKSVFLCRQVRRALRSGRYLPGQRIDPATLAAEFDTSATPVRLALYRLVGEGLIADHARSGLYVPLPTEVALRDLYDWMQRLLLTACDICSEQATPKPVPPEPSLPEDDVFTLTWQLFDAIASATLHSSLHEAVKQTNDRLAPIRRSTAGLIENTSEELSALSRHWQQRDTQALKSALRDYYERRKQLVPCIVARLNECSAQFQ